ncbi:MAG: hypothetical protein AAFV53_37040 [Myxococcota bacterium]
MFKRNILSVAALSAFVFLAFGSTPEIMEEIEKAANEGSDGDMDIDIDINDVGSGSASGGGGNVAACKRYIQHFNDLDCMPDSAELNVDDTCPDILDQSPVNMASYYDCMVENSTCNGNIPDISGMTNCKMPSM